MTILRTLIAMFPLAEQPTTGNGLQLPSQSEDEHSRFDAIWDDALIASIHCETARAFLDRMGPRWK